MSSIPDSIPASFLIQEA